MIAVELTPAEHELVLFWMRTVDDPSQQPDDRATARAVIAKLVKAGRAARKRSAEPVSFETRCGGHLTHVNGRPQHIASCSCGWMGPRRILLDLATDDAIEHVIAKARP